MIDYVPFYTHIWVDKNFCSLSKDGKLLFIYLFTNRDITLTGIYTLDAIVCKLKMGLNDEEFNDTIQEVTQNGMVEYDINTDMIWVVNRFKLMSNHSPKVIAGAMRELSLTKHTFKEKFIARYRDLLKTEIWRLPEYKEDLNSDYYLQPAQLYDFNKYYKTKNELKNFLMKRGVAEREIDDVLPKILPNLK